MRANKIVFMPLNGYLDLISYFSWSLIGDQTAVKRRQKNEFIALGIKRQNALFHALPLAPFYRLIAFDLYPTACYSEQQYKWKQCDSEWQEKELKGNFQLRFAEGLLRVWSTLWLITELSNDKEPVVHRNLFFLTISLQFFWEKKWYWWDFYIHIMSAPITIGTKKTKFILKLLGNPQIDAFFCDICAHWKTYCYRRTATALKALILCIGWKLQLVCSWHPHALSTKMCSQIVHF